MGKLLTRLNQQLNIKDCKKDAEECIQVYNWIKDNHKGSVWSSTWRPLVNVEHKGFPSDKRTYSLSIVGKMLLRGINCKKLKYER